MINAAICYNNKNFTLITNITLSSQFPKIKFHMDMTTKTSRRTHQFLEVQEVQLDLEVPEPNHLQSIYIR